MLKPKSNPEYYEKLLQELDEAPSRSWWQAQLNNWKGYIRFQ
jgi:cytochrome b pre-mRNA-processing protein 6